MYLGHKSLANLIESNIQMVRKRKHVKVSHVMYVTRVSSPSMNTLSTSAAIAETDPSHVQSVAKHLK